MAKKCPYCYEDYNGAGCPYCGYSENDNDEDTDTDEEKDDW